MEIPGYIVQTNGTLTTPATGGSGKPSGDAFNSLYPAIVECFTIILLGYVTGRGGWITTTQAKGLNSFTSMFALPALLFSNMATLDWSVVEWKFIGAIFISKAMVFTIALVFTLFLKRPFNIGLAALAGIFVTQSNDFALGYPIVRAIYSKTEPQFLQYIYLVAPISLLVLNPIGFVLLEIQKASSQNVKSRKGLLALKVLKQIVTNPIIVMTALGVIANFIFNHKLPLLIDNLLSTLGQAFSACALFILGLSIVGKFQKSMKPLLIGSGLLIFVKLLLLPMTAVGITRVLGCGESTNSSAQYSMFAFLYGTFPTAPSVFLYATQYSVGVDLVATSLVLGTVAAAPLMFTSAMMFGMQIFTMDVTTVLNNTMLDVSVVALICSVAVVLIFIVTRRASRMPHMMVLIIALLQIMITVGCIIEASVTVEGDSDKLAWWEYMKVCLHSLGILGVSTMTSVSAITIYCISCHSLCRALVLRPWLLFYGLGSPVLLLGIVLIVGSLKIKPEHSLMAFGKVQMSVMSGVLLINIFVTIITLILRHRRSDKLTNDQSNDVSRSSDGRSASFTSASSEDSSLTGSGSENGRKCYGSCHSIEESDSTEDSYKLKNSRHKKAEDKEILVHSSHAADIEDIVPFPRTSNTAIQDSRLCQISEKCTPEKIRKCKSLLDKYDKVNGDNVYVEGYQMGRVMALLIILVLCQITMVFFYAWQLFFSDMFATGLFVEIEFISLVLSSGQGFFTFITFGLDSEVLLMPIKRLVLKVIQKIKGKKTVPAAPSEESVHVSQQFSEYHHTHCVQTIEKVPGTKTLCFTGSALVAYLIDAGLSMDQTEAQIYGEHLLQGGVIRGCSKRAYSFLDSSKHLYRFTRSGCGSINT